MFLGVTENRKSRLTEARPDFKARYDVIVVGLGTAGTEAALVAAALGLRVLGVEKHNAMGGLSTIGCVWFKWKNTNNVTLNPDRVLENHRANAPITFLEIAERMGLYEREADVSGLTLAYETVPVGAWVDGGKIVGTRLLCNGHVYDAAARIVIDATGNAAVARMAGCRIRSGRPWDNAKGAVARAELWALPDGVNRPTYANYDYNASCGVPEYSAILSKLATYRHRVWKDVKPHVLRPALILGAREEDRVETETIVTLKDCLCGKPYPDPIFHTFTPEDLVRVDEDFAFESEETQNWKMICGLPQFGYPATLPYGSLLAKDVASLLVPSKHFGVSHDAGGGIRMQDAMRSTGYAAACAAFLAIQDNIPLKDVPYAKLRPLLDKGGILSKPRKIRVDSVNGVPFPPLTPEETVATLRQDIAVTGEWWNSKTTGDAREKAAFALWTAWQTFLKGSADAHNALADMLFDECQKGGRHAGNFAVALGLMADKRACPVLRSLVATPGASHPDGADPVVPHAYPNRIKAICLLGRLGDQAVIPALQRIVLDDAAAFTSDLTAAKVFRTEHRYRFEALSYSLMSLRKLLDIYPSPAVRAEILEWNRKPLTLKSERDGRDLAPLLKKIIS